METDVIGGTGVTVSWVLDNGPPDRGGREVLPEVSSTLAVTDVCTAAVTWSLLMAKMAFISMPIELDVGEVLTVVIVGGEVVVWDVELASVILDF